MNNFLNRHEGSILHEQAITSLLVCKNKDARIDSQFVNQIETEQKCWHTLLERIISVVPFLAERRLSFGVVGLLHNGNYLGSLELIAKFNNFMWIFSLKVSDIFVNGIRQRHN